MRSIDRAGLAPLGTALASIALLGACATGHNRTAAGVTLLQPAKQAAIGSFSSSMLKFKYANLARIDPDHPLAEGNARQTLSLFGREDLIALASADYAPTGCAASNNPADVFYAIEQAARKTSVVIVNESHERSQHRGFIAQIAQRLRPLGYDVLAIETLSNPVPDTPPAYLPIFLKKPALPHLVDNDGFYLSEAGFGRLGRQAKALGYRLVPYEFNEQTEPVPDRTEAQQIAVREEAQARNLADYLKDHPGSRMLIHVGYRHAGEVPSADGARWMAARLKEMTGIDPLTISQVTCRGGGDTVRLAAPPFDQPAGLFDLVIDHPTARFVRGRPEWRVLAGDRATDIPAALRPKIGWRVIEARPAGEPDTAVPMDRVAIRPGDDTALMLPPGRYDLQIIDVAKPAPTPPIGAH